MQYWVIQQSGGQTWNGGTDFKWGGRAPLNPRWQWPWIILRFNELISNRTVWISTALAFSLHFFRIILVVSTSSGLRYVQESKKISSLWLLVWTSVDNVFSTIRTVYDLFLELKPPVQDAEEDGMKCGEDVHRCAIEPAFVGTGAVPDVVGSAFPDALAAEVSFVTGAGDVWEEEDAEEDVRACQLFVEAVWTVLDQLEFFSFSKLEVKLMLLKFS